MAGSPSPRYSQVSRRRPDGSRVRTGRYLGPIEITPIRAVLGIAFFGSLAYIGIAIVFVKNSAQLPMVTSGLAVLGFLFASLSLGGAIRMWRAWQDGSQASTFLFALLGGIAGMIALGCFAGTLVLALVWRS
jgi:hypothetical protein